MDDDIKESLTATETWVRGLYMILFTIIYSITELVLTAVVIFQFVIYLLTRDTNDRLLEFGEDLGIFIYQIIQFLTFNSEEKPFPFGPWPYGDGPGEPVETSPTAVTESTGGEVEPEGDKATKAAKSTKTGGTKAKAKAKSSAKSTRSAKPSSAGDDKEASE